ncbi:MAG: hypothetical protein ACKVJ1_01310 [Verrucomicrobiia bacterium]
MVTDHAVRKQSEGVGGVAVKLARSFHADTASAVRVVHEDKFSSVGVGFFYRWELSCLGSVRFVLLAA